MALTPAADALTQAQIAVQQRISAQTVLASIALWKQLKPYESDVAQQRWLEVMVQLVRVLNGRSAAVARDYLTAFRRVEGMPNDGFTPPLIGDIDVERLVASLTIVGPHEAKQRVEQAGGTPVPSALDKIATSTAGVAQRHVVNGSRDTISATIEADRKVRGYQRITDADPCYFCAMLASRGPVYQDDSFDDADPRFYGPGDYKVHDHCNCSLEPIYHVGINPASRAEEFEALWRETGATKSGREAIKEFRRAYEGRA